MKYLARDADGASWTTTTTTADAEMTIHGVQINGWNLDERLTAATPSAGSYTPAGTGNSKISSSDGGGSLSNPVKIGIGVGVSLGVIGLAALGVGLLMMYRSRRAARARRPCRSCQPASSAATVCWV